MEKGLHALNSNIFHMYNTRKAMLYKNMDTLYNIQSDELHFLTET